MSLLDLSARGQTDRLFFRGGEVAALVGGGQRIWTALPRHIFGGADRGLLLCPADLPSLAQDSAGTMPVTAPGQPVGLLRDLSGNALHAMQGSHAARPTYGMDADGRPFLALDGINDSLSTGAVTLGAAGRTLMVALRKRSDAAVGAVIETGAQWSFLAGGAAIMAPGIAGSGNFGGRAMPAAEPSVLHSASSFAAPHVAVVTAISSGGSHLLRVNGTQVASATPAGPISALTAPLHIGARTGSQLFAAVDLYAVLVIDRVLSAAELALAEAWAADRSGVVLA